jgi:hypothetical protein
MTSKFNNVSRLQPRYHKLKRRLAYWLLQPKIRLTLLATLLMVGLILSAISGPVEPQYVVAAEGGTLAVNAAGDTLKVDSLDSLASIKPQTTAAKKPVSTPHPPSAPAPTSNAGVWDAIAACETHDNWSENTGNGYYGGLQFLYSTWTKNGGPAFNTGGLFPFSREQQIAVAEHIRAGAGGSYRAWGYCAYRLGLN